MPLNQWQKQAKLAVRMTNLKKPPASWRCLPRHVLHESAISPRGVAPRVPLLPQSVITQPQQDEAQGAVQNNLLLPHQPTNNLQALRLKVKQGLMCCPLQFVVLAADTMQGVMRQVYMLCCAEQHLSSAEQIQRTVSGNAQGFVTSCIPTLPSAAEPCSSKAQRSTGIIPEDLKSYFSFIGSLTGSHDSSEGELIQFGATLHHALS